jgi:MFS family permease
MARAAEAPYPPASVGWYAAIVLAVLYWVSILDRFIIALVVDPIKRDLRLTDLQFSVLQGFAFTGTQLLFGLLFGALADRHSRRRLIFAGALMIAAASDLFFGGGASIGLGMALVIAVCCPLGAAFLFMGLRPMRTAVAAAEHTAIRDYVDNTSAAR